MVEVATAITTVRVILTRWRRDDLGRRACEAGSGNAGGELAATLRSTASLARSAVKSSLVSSKRQSPLERDALLGPDVNPQEMAERLTARLQMAVHRLLVVEARDRGRSDASPPPSPPGIADRAAPHGHACARRPAVPSVAADAPASIRITAAAPIGGGARLPPGRRRRDRGRRTAALRRGAVGPARHRGALAVRARVARRRGRSGCGGCGSTRACGWRGRSRCYGRSATPWRCRSSNSRRTTPRVWRRRSATASTPRRYERDQVRRVGAGKRPLARYRRRTARRVRALPLLPPPPWRSHRCGSPWDQTTQASSSRRR